MNETVSFASFIVRDSDFLEILKEQDILILCRSKSTGKERHTRFSALYRNNERFWESPGWDFLMSEEDRHNLIVILDKNRRLLTGEIDQISLKDRPVEPEVSGYGNEYDEVVDMPLDVRKERIVHAINNLDEALDRPRVSSHDIASLMADAAIYSTVINKVSLEEMADEDNLASQRQMLQITEKTGELMGSFIRALSRNYNLNQTAEIITDKTAGATSRHMNRVFILSIRFLDELRHEFEYAGLYQRLQSRLSAYLPFYEPLKERYNFKQFDKSIIMKSPPSFKGKKMEEMMLGILLHDLGKRRNLLYFDGSGEYNRLIIENHAFDGYFMLMKKTSYRQSIAYVAGLHHEYYGHKGGYGVFRDNFTEYSEKVRNHRFDSIFTHNYEDISSFKSVAYFPAKILEIVDVYDALTDKDRLYKDPMSPGEALVFMRKTMIDEDLKLDPILFDLFVRFLKKAKLI
ncbi:MAG: hypothetical protein PQJ59_18825 [Spirochaetales bacterium]|nr:hypothetical protein [Spirochaetales bacterium]